MVSTKEVSMRIIGRKFLVNGVRFTVCDTEPYAPGRITPQYRDLLKFPAGQVVAISYRGTLIPNITLGANEGVVRLTTVKVGEQVLTKPGQISRVLKLSSDMRAYALTPVLTTV